MKRNPFDRMEDAIIDFQGTAAAFTAIFDGNTNERLQARAMYGVARLLEKTIAG